MGRIAKILSFVRVIRNGANVSDIKTDPGGGANVTVEHFAPLGDDSHPLNTDYVATMDISRTGGGVAVGFVDPLNAPKASPGDKRIYGRDADTGAVVVEIWLKNDGTAIVSNDNGSVVLSPGGSIKGDNGSGSFELAEGGDFLVNGVTIDTGGNISATSVAATSVAVAGKEMSGHTHSQGNDSSGDTQAITNGPT